MAKHHVFHPRKEPRKRHFLLCDSILKRQREPLFNGNIYTTPAGTDYNSLHEYPEKQAIDELAG
jgi:hypothetical protein